MPLDLLPIGLTVVVTIAWSLIQVTSGIAVKTTSISLYSALSLFVGSVLVGVYLLFNGGLSVPDPGLALVAALGGLLDSFIGFMIYLRATKMAELHVVTSLSNTVPFWAVVNAVLLLGEAARAGVFAAAVLIVAGSFLMVSARRMSLRSIASQGAALALVSGFIWGISESIPSKYALNNGMPLISYLFILATVSCAAWTIMAALDKFRGRIRYSSTGLKLAVLRGFLTIFLGWMLWLEALSLTDASLLAPLRGLMVPFAFVFSIILVKERPTKKSFLGLVLIMAGLVLVSLSA